MQADAEIFLEHSQLGRPLAVSVVLHAAVTGLILLCGNDSFARQRRRVGRRRRRRRHGRDAGQHGTFACHSRADPECPGERLEGTDQVATANESDDEPDAIPIPDKNAKIKPKPVTTASKQKPRAQPAEETNEVPFGQGGPVSGPYGTFSSGGAKGGFGFQGGGGDFGSAYAWYVRVVQQKVSENWLKYEIDPNIHQANRVYVQFDINRSGPAEQCTNRAVERGTVARPVGGASHSAHRHLRAAAAGLLGQQGDGGILV